MSKTYIDKEYGRWKYGIDNKPSQRLQSKFDRWNFEIGDERARSNARKSVGKLESQDFGDIDYNKVKQIKQKERSKLSKRYMN